MTARLPVVIAVATNKGGVGKTTTAVNLSAALAAPQRRVLLIDLDSQACASLWHGIDRARLRPSSASVLLNDLPIEQAIRPTTVPNLDLITGSGELVNADLVLGEVKGREQTLRHLVRQLKSHYDLLVLDCPPNLSLVGVNALVAADAVIAPVAPQFLAVEGLVSLLASLETVRLRLGVRNRLLGILISAMDGAAKNAIQIRDGLRTEYRDRMFHTEIPMSRSLADAPGAAQTIFAYAPHSRAADSYRRLAGEVLERLRHH
jgi:chromosome partitioning protein